MSKPQLISSALDNENDGIKESEIQMSTCLNLQSWKCKCTNPAFKESFTENCPRKNNQI